MSSSDDFQRKKWDKRSTRTDIPQVAENPSSTDAPYSDEDTDSMPENAEILLWLIVSSPREFRGTVLPVEDGVLIGRHGDIRWHDPRMSRKHARFAIMSDPVDAYRQIFAIEPHQDRNGTMVNGKRISGRTPLYENDTILMGDTRFVVKVLQ